MRPESQDRCGRLRAFRFIFRGSGLSKRVCIFVDGENFRKSIVKLFADFDQKDYLPRQATWASLFDFLTATTTKGAERIRTYWYVIKHIDFAPYSLPKLELWQGAPKHFTPEKLLNGAKNILSKGKDNPYKEELNNLEGDKLKERLKD